MVMHHHELECDVKRLLCYLQVQALGHRPHLFKIGLSSMYTFELLIRLQPNLF